jgi:hypothetical protein
MNLGSRFWCLRKQGPEAGRRGEGTCRGKASWFDDAAVFDDTAAEDGPSACQRRSSRKAGSSGVVAAKDARSRAACSRAADKAAGGRHGAGELRSRLSSQYRAVSEGGDERALAQDAPLGLWRSGSWRFAVKRSSTWVRERNVTWPQGCGARRERDLGIGQHIGCSCRESVAEVGETHLFRRRGEARGNP